MKTFLKSFIYAFRGLKLLFNERNFIIEFFISLFVVLAAYLLQVNSLEWLIILICCSLVLSLEAINTVIEKTLDFLKPEQDKRTEIIKDMAAGAVLVASIFSVIIGIIIFLPYVLHLISILKS